jgi:hypothetical protein
VVAGQAASQTTAAAAKIAANQPNYIASISARRALSASCSRCALLLRIF